MTHYETVIIFSPLLSEDDVKKATKHYIKFLGDHKATIVEENYWGLKSMAYQISGKQNGIYFVTEFAGDSDLVAKFEIELKRDETILRFMTIKLDKFAIDYNDRKRKGLIGRKAAEQRKEKENTQTLGA
jgi:small subunit ribosomal protein S6